MLRELKVKECVIMDCFDNDYVVRLISTDARFVKFLEKEEGIKDGKLQKIVKSYDTESEVVFLGKNREDIFDVNNYKTVYYPSNEFADLEYCYDIREKNNEEYFFFTTNENEDIFDLFNETSIIQLKKLEELKNEPEIVFISVKNMYKHFFKYLYDIDVIVNTTKWDTLSDNYTCSIIELPSEMDENVKKDIRRDFRTYFVSKISKDEIYSVLKDEVDNLEDNLDFLNRKYKYNIKVETNKIRNFITQINCSVNTTIYKNKNYDNISFKIFDFTSLKKIEINIKILLLLLFDLKDNNEILSNNECVFIYKKTF